MWQENTTRRLDTRSGRLGSLTDFDRRPVDALAATVNEHVALQSRWQVEDHFTAAWLKALLPAPGREDARRCSAADVVGES